MVRFFEKVLLKPIGHKLMRWQSNELIQIYGTIDEYTGLRVYRKTFQSVAKQNGKQLDIETKVPRPGGWSTMGDLRVGDFVLSEKLRPIQITHKSEIDNTERAFRLTFGDGNSIVAGERHEWMARLGSGAERIYTSNEMFEASKDLKVLFRIQRAKSAREFKLVGSHEIRSIVEVDRRPMQCIQVDSDTHLYLAGEGMVPTHNSFLVGGLPLYHILVEIEEELNPQAYGVASAKDQAGIVFDAAKLFIDNNPMLQKQVLVRESTKRIIRRDRRGLYRVLAADGGQQDGKRPSLLIFDELHRFTRKNAKEVHSVLTKGTISRKQPLTIQITTSGDEQESPLWAEEYDNALHVIDGSLSIPTLYASIYQADAKKVTSDPDYWRSKEARVAANPSHEDRGGFLKDDQIVEFMNEAQLKPEKKAGYIRLHLNVPFSQSETPAITMSDWYLGGGGVDLREWQTYDVDRLIRKWKLLERACVLGVDLAWTTDFTALACLFPPTDNFDISSKDPWTVLLFFWIPEGRREFIEGRTRTPLKDWISRGFMSTVPGNEMNLKVVEDKIKWATEMFDVKELTFDKWGGMRALANRLVDDEGMTAVDVRQGYQTLSSPTKEFVAMHMSNRITHGNNPILNWNASCLALLDDGNDNVRPSKPERLKSAKRIDGCAAIINALSRAVMLQGSESVYATRGPLILG